MVNFNDVIIQIPTTFLAERSYIVKIIIGDFLGITYQIEGIDNIIDYKLILPNFKEITIKDSFFSTIKTETYLLKENIPETVFFSENVFSNKESIAILFGDSSLIDKKDEIICGNDIFAASFFMLTRWEEFVINEKDEFGRFPEEMALSIRQGFHMIPIVNQYLEMLWNMLVSLGFDGKRKSKNYQLKITHDIDFFKKLDSPTKLLKALLGDLIKRKNIIKAIETIYLYAKIQVKKAKDPFDVFDFFMDISEKFHLKSHFYFIPSGMDKYSTYSIENKELRILIQRIIDRKHSIGYHASWLAFENIELFEKEVNTLKNIGIEITEGRQHYLRFQVPNTWNTWEYFGFEEDSSLGFSKTIGFRAGTCYEYNVFDILSKKELNLRENPLIAMDTALLNKYKNVNEITKSLLEISETIKKYQGNFVLLWHNNNINYNFGKNFSHIYDNLIRSLSDK